jgi:hypothetical protein
MQRQEMIKILVQSALVNKPNATKEEVAEYVKYLEGKTDLELQNMVMINCF